MIIGNPQYSVLIESACDNDFNNKYDILNLI